MSPFLFFYCSLFIATFMPVGLNLNTRGVYCKTAMKGGLQAMPGLYFPHALEGIPALPNLTRYKYNECYTDSKNLSKPYLNQDPCHTTSDTFGKLSFSVLFTPLIQAQN